MRSPLLGLAFCAVGGAFFGRGFLLFGFFCLAIAGICLRRHWSWFLAAVVSVGLSSWQIARQDARVVELAQQLNNIGKIHAIEGFVDVGSYVWPGSSVEDRLGTIHAKTGESWKVVVSSYEANWVAGSRYEVVGSLFLPELPRNPGEMSRRDLWRAKGAVAGLRVDEVTPSGRVWWLAWQRWAEEARMAVKKRILAGLDEESVGAKVILAMVLGEKPPSNSELTEAFRLSGCLHVFAVSGLHVTLVGSLFWLILGRFGVSRAWASIIVILAMFGYSLLTGARPPAMRASVMGTVFISAFIFRRRPDLLNAWAFCLCLAIWWRPEQLFNLGFQLSYGVLLSIAFGVAFFERWTSKIGELDPFMPRSLLNNRQEKWLGLRRWTSGTLAVSLAAWLGSLPLIAWHFGLVTPISVVAALIMIPLTYFILGLGISSALVGLIFPWGGMVLNQVNEKLASGSYYAAAFFTKVPGGHYKLPPSPPGEMVIYDLAGGGAAWLQAGGGVLMDAGNDRDFSWTVLSGLRQWRAEPDTLVLSHPDVSHVGGMALALEEYDCRQALIPVAEARSSAYRTFLSEARAANCDLVLGKKGAIYELEKGIHLEVLWAGESGSGWLADDQGMVVRVHWQGWKILFTGDSGLRASQEMLASGVDLRADVVVMGRHVGGGSGELGFLQKTEALAVISSNSFYPEYERAPSGWRESVEAAGIRVMDQGETGAVIFDISDEELLLKSFLQPEKLFTLEKP